MRVVIVTGLSGAGKSTAMRALEDLGYYCCDNLPIPLMQEFSVCLESRGVARVALSVDARQHAFIELYTAQVDRLTGEGHAIDVLFLEAPDDVLVRRYSETRRRHPLSGSAVHDGIRQDREVLAPLRESATVINTANLNVHELTTIVKERFEPDDRSMSITFESFGFKHGTPVNCDLVFDVRFLPNPHFDPVLGPLDGREPVVANFVFESPDSKELVDRIVGFLDFTLPKFAEEGKLYLTVGVGCTGGRHRSVAVVEELSRRMSETWHVLIRHRDIQRGR